MKLLKWIVVVMFGLVVMYGLMQRIDEIGSSFSRAGILNRL